MEFRGQTAEVFVSGPNGDAATTVVLSGARASVGRLPELNDIGLQPDPQRVVSRAGHCTFEREGRVWFVADGGSVNGTFLRRGERAPARRRADGAPRRRRRLRSRRRRRARRAALLRARLSRGAGLAGDARGGRRHGRVPALRRRRSAARSRHRAARRTRSRSAPRRTGSCATWSSGARAGGAPRSARTTS